jgi:hypothetical protein
LDVLELKNGGTFNLYSTAKSIKKINLNGGMLRIGSAPAKAFDGVIADIAGKMAYTASDGKFYKGSEGQIAIDAGSYPWKGGSAELDSSTVTLETAGSGAIELAAGGRLAVTTKFDVGVTDVYCGTPIQLGNATFTLSGGEIRLLTEDNDVWATDEGNAYPLAIDLAEGGNIVFEGVEKEIGETTWKYAPLINVVSDVTGSDGESFAELYPNAGVWFANGKLQVQSAMEWAFATRRTSPLVCKTGTIIKFADACDEVGAGETALPNGSYQDSGTAFSGGTGVLFSSKVVKTSGAATAVKIEKGGAGNSATLEFANEPWVMTEVSDGEGNPINAHIYGKSTGNSATGIDLANGANLIVDGVANYRPTLVAYGKNESGGNMEIGRAHV